MVRLLNTNGNLQHLVLLTVDFLTTTAEALALCFNSVLLHHECSFSASGIVKKTSFSAALFFELPAVNKEYHRAICSVASRWHGAC